MKRIIYVFAFICFSTISFAQTTGDKTNPEKSYGPLYFEIVGINDESFPKWNEMSASSSFEEYINQVRNWILTHRTEYYEALEKRKDLSSFTIDELQKMNETDATAAKTRLNDWGVLMVEEKKINESYPFIAELQTRLSSRTTVYICVVHSSDLTLISGK